MYKICALWLILALLLSLSACQRFSAPDDLQTHTLIDKIWSVSRQQFISKADLQQQTLTHQVVFLGETHDNIRHHQLQAQFIQFLVTNNHRPAVAFEMLNQNQQDIIQTFQTRHYLSNEQTRTANNDSGEKNTALFAEKIAWEKSGWPEWSFYHPVFYQTINNELPIIAANLELEKIRRLIKKGPQSLTQKYQSLLTKYQYSQPLKQELEQEVQAAHCDILPEKMLAPMLLGQQTRDLAMMQAIQSTLKKTSQVVVIAGSGHTRTDYGIPFYLQQEVPGLQMISIAFIELNESDHKPADYLKSWSKTATRMPFDYIWFTTRAEREDQCQKMKLYMQKKHQKQTLSQ